MRGPSIHWGGGGGLFKSGGHVLRNVDSLGGGGGHVLRNVDSLGGGSLLRHARGGLDSLSGVTFGGVKRFDSLRGHPPPPSFSRSSKTAAYSNSSSSSVISSELKQDI
uniref:Uncharacterized protein n=1 Tax=Timema monikensis TaxID=170555 RepID=A0A7R9HU08_9NEOP|nr:unnamed protein product [Timema monikensis]